MTQVFHIVPASVRPVWFLVPMVLLVVVIAAASAVLVGSMRGARTTTFELSDQGLRIRGDLYGRLVPWRALRGAGATRVDISHGPWRLVARTMGTAMPGYRSGWFRLANGEKALVYVTDPASVVYVPTAGGYALLLSVANADEFVDRLHAMGSREAMSGGRTR